MNRLALALAAAVSLFALASCGGPPAGGPDGKGSGAKIDPASINTPYSAIAAGKVDIEGGETRLFSKGIDKWLGKVEAVVVECHGSAAQETVHAALPSPTWTHSVSGENDVFIRATAPFLGKEHANE